jgi:prepilin peptidase dependent protein B
MLMFRRRQGGVSLIELMIGILVGMIVIAATIAIYVSTLRGGNNTLRTARLNQELRATMDVMVREIRRAGFNGWNPTGLIVLSTNNNFTKRGENGLQTDLRVQNGGDCILFSYDLPPWVDIDESDPLNVAAPFEASDYMGFKLSNGAVSMRSSGSTTNSANCSDGTWEAITDPNTITVTALTFSTLGSQCTNFTTGGVWKVNVASQTSACNEASGNVSIVRAPHGVTSGNQLVEGRQMVITLSGQVTADTSIRATMTEEVQVRNDRIYTQP